MLGQSVIVCLQNFWSHLLRSLTGKVLIGHLWREDQLRIILLVRHYSRARSIVHRYDLAWLLRVRRAFTQALHRLLEEPGAVSRRNFLQVVFRRGLCVLHWTHRCHTCRPVEGCIGLLGFYHFIIATIRQCITLCLRKFVMAPVAFAAVYIFN